MRSDNFGAAYHTKWNVVIMVIFCHCKTKGGAVLLEPEFCWTLRHSHAHTSPHFFSHFFSISLSLLPLSSPVISSLSLSLSCTHTLSRTSTQSHPLYVPHFSPLRIHTSSHISHISSFLSRQIQTLIYRLTPTPTTTTTHTQIPSCSEDIGERN